jgi:hypothetical protein
MLRRSGTNLYLKKHASIGRFNLFIIGSSPSTTLMNENVTYDGTSKIFTFDNILFLDMES